MSRTDLPLPGPFDMTNAARTFGAVPRRPRRRTRIGTEQANRRVLADVADRVESATCRSSTGPRRSRISDRSLTFADHKRATAEPTNSADGRSDREVVENPV
jgi:hypothetical protein